MNAERRPDGPERGVARAETQQQLSPRQGLRQSHAPTQWIGRQIDELYVFDGAGRLRNDLGLGSQVITGKPSAQRAMAPSPEIVVLVVVGRRTELRLHLGL